MRLADGRVLRTIRAPDLAPAKPFVWDLLLLGVGISLAGVIHRRAHLSGHHSVAYYVGRCSSRAACYWRVAHFRSHEQSNRPARWLAEDTIRPWQHRSWIFPRDPRFSERAGPVLDLYQRRWAGELLHPGEFVICADEKVLGMGS